MTRLLAMCTAAGLSATAFGQLDAHKIFSGDAAADDDAFGQAVDVDGDRLIVGMPFDDEAATAAGAAMVFERDGDWTAVAKLMIDDPHVWDGVGSYIAIEGDVAVIGHPYRSANRGAAYIFQRDAEGVWSQSQRLDASDAAPGDLFGYRVEIDNEVIYVSAPYDTDLGYDTGAIYVFERSGDDWVEVDKLLPDVNEGQFGRRMDVDGGRLIVTAPTEVYAVSQVLVYDRIDGELVYQGSVQADEPDPSSAFGWALDVSGDVIVVGAPDYGATPFELGGAAYIFERNEAGAWEEVKFHQAGGYIDYAGKVAVDGDRVLVSGIGSFFGPFTGAVYAFERTAPGVWEEQPALESGVNGDSFGSGLSMHDGVVVIGAPTDNEQAGGAGAAYIMDAACAADANADGAVNILDFLAFQQQWQTGDAAADCDDNGVLNVLDFVCFQAVFVEGCS